ncbi:MAG: hypothetical protein AABX86_01295, partial [Nanoarchaeota archaeon]
RGSHSSLKYFTGALDFRVEVDLTAEQVKARFNRDLVAHAHFFHKEELSNFIIEHYLKKKDLIEEGCANFLADLSKEKFEE